MPKFTRLRIEWPICHACKINKTFPSLGGITKTKNITISQKNKVKLAKPMQSNDTKLLSS